MLRTIFQAWVEMRDTSRRHTSSKRPCPNTLVSTMLSPHHITTPPTWRFDSSMSYDGLLLSFLPDKFCPIVVLCNSASAPEPIEIQEFSTSYPLLKLVVTDRQTTWNRSHLAGHLVPVAKRQIFGWARDMCRRSNVTHIVLTIILCRRTGQ